MVHSHREGTQKPRRERLPWVFGPQMPASPLGTVWLRGTWHSQGGKAAMLPKNPALPWLYTGSGEPGQGESLPSHAASVSPDVEGTRQPTRDRGKAILDPPSPRGGGGGTGGPQPRVGAAAGPCLHAQRCRERGDKADPPRGDTSRGDTPATAGMGKGPKPPQGGKKGPKPGGLLHPQGGMQLSAPPQG